MMTGSERDRLRGEGLSDEDLEIAIQNLREAGKPITKEEDALATLLEGWTPPIPLGDQKQSLPFPTDKLPGPLTAMVEQAAQFTQTDEAMCGTLALAMLSTAFQARYVVEVRPLWEEQMSLYCVCVAPPGEKKSPCFSLMTAPFREYEKQRAAEEAAEIEKNRSERRMLEAAQKRYEADATNGKSQEDRDQSHNAALETAEKLSKFVDKFALRLFCDDVTPERLERILYEQGGVLTLASAEGSMLTSFGRYSKDGQAHFDVLLKGHSGDMLRIDRGSQERTFTIDKPRLTLALAVQPKIISDVLSSPALTGRGLPARILYAVCKSKMGSRAASPPLVNAEDYRKYCEFCKDILTPGRFDPLEVLRLSEEAQKVREDYHNLTELRLATVWQNDMMREWANKLVGQTVRIAGLLHCGYMQAAGKDPLNSLISREEMEAAVAFSQYYAANAKNIFAEAENGGTSDAQYVLGKIRELGAPEIPRRQLQQICKNKSTLKKAEDFDRVLGLLEQHNYIRAAREPGEDRIGRPKESLRVNPYYLYEDAIRERQNK